MEGERVEKENKIYPFYCGSQSGDWKSRNCDRCKKGYKDKWNCDLEKSLDAAYASDGSVSPEVAQRIGFKPSGGLSWVCPEREIRS